MKYTTLIVVFVVVTATLTACTHTQSGQVVTPGGNGDQAATNGNAPAADQKSGDTTKTGVITQAGEAFFLTESGQQPLPIDSYAVDLSSYVGKTVTVTGQYSGNELFVGSVE